MSKRPSAENAVSALCPRCGLCCNGVLFGDVKLQQGDNANRLRSLHLQIRRKGRTSCFLQPCPAFDGTWCGIYEDRPDRCRAFECGVLKRFQDGAITKSAALHHIRGARRQAERVRALLRRVGARDETSPLAARYKQIMSAPLDLAGDDQAAATRGRLMRAMEQLMTLLQREFLSEPPP